jgi:rhodanese-related sulfurtransferase
MRHFQAYAFALLSLLGISCAQGQPRVGSKAYAQTLKALLAHSVDELSVAEADSLTSALFLDARAPAEFAVSRIPGARHVGYERFDLASVAGLPREQPLVVYCSVGYRSEKVAEQLKAAGFSRVYNLYGGIFEWANEGKPLVDSQGAPTQRVHGYSRSWGIWLREGEAVYEKKGSPQE